MEIMFVNYDFLNLLHWSFSAAGIKTDRFCPAKGASRAFDS